MKIGDLLLKRGWVEWEPLALAIDDQRGTGVRMASFLVARGDVDFDDASRALAEQLGAAPALRRHLERRDPALTTALPVRVARKLIALPLGRLPSGALVVCVRDPSPAVRAELASVAGTVVLAVAPARYLERIVANTYPRGMSAEHDIAMDVDDEPADSGFELVDDGGDSDDSDAADFAIDIEVPSEPVKPVSTSRALPVEFKAKATGPAAVRDALDATLAACREIDERGWLLDVVMEYIAKRWAASILFEIRDRRAAGVRGHGSKLKPATIKTFVLALDEPSVVQLARDERRPVDRLPDPPGEDDTSLASALACQMPYAVPITRGDSIAYVLVVGDPIGKDPEETEIDLGMLVEAVGDALVRL